MKKETKEAIIEALQIIAFILLIIFALIAESLFENIFGK